MWHSMNHLMTALQVDSTGQPVQYSNYGQPVVVDQSWWQQITSALTQSTQRVLENLAHFLPGVVALIIALALFTGIGALAAFILRKVLTAIKFDDRVGNGKSSSVIPNLQDWAPSHSPTALVARTAFWGFVLLGCVIGISAFDSAYTGSSQVALFLLPYLTHSVGALLLFFAGNLIARFLARSVLIGAVNAQLQYARFLSLGVKWLVLVLTAAMVLDHLQIGGLVVELAFGILFGGIVLTLSLAVGLGSREIVSRSLERNVERAPEAVAPTPAAEAGESLRHF
ncbi:hypothetical protein SAMN05421770_105227 [Granulicella rosea]|uniref:Uncharacterized protein n=2 Tax=Granulicella rosea TaxID=474952 RepID=A0A239KVX0_9BACT|nr:hypothetical protein SAMN05421770_105227 [Granulicella rosea]